MKEIIKGIPLELLPQKLLFLPEYKILCLADWHLGKAAHFRKSGIPVPQPNLEAEFQGLQEVIDRKEVKQVLFLGDLFHSSSNNDWFLFEFFINRFSDVDFLLIKGNHDIIHQSFFEEIGVKIADTLSLDNRLLFSHEPLHQQTPTGFLNVAGHIHPGYRIAMRARQSVLLPCFHYSRSTLTLPAFGSLTGLFQPGYFENDEFYCILGEEVVRI